MSAATSMLDLRTLRARRAMPTGSGASRRRRLGSVRLVRTWAERARQRRQLLALASDPDLLHDIGLSRAEVEREAGRPFWRE